MQKVYLIISIDTECDKGPSWKLQVPMSFNNVLSGLSDNFAPLLVRYKIKPTYLLSPEVLTNDDCIEYFKSLTALELGTHLHGEFIAPDADWNAERTEGIQADMMPEVERKKLENLTLSFQNRFGYKPLSFRAGRYGISKYTFRYLHQMGYRVDSSVTPYKTHYYESGTINSFWGKPFYPYRIPTTSLIQVPVSIFNPDFSTLPGWVLRYVQDKRTLSKRILGRLGYRSKSVWVRPYKSSAEEMKIASDWIVSATPPGKSPVINIMFHSNEIWPGASPYCQTQEEVTKYIQSLDDLFRHLHANYEVCSIGLGEYADFFQ